MSSRRRCGLRDMTNREPITTTNLDKTSETEPLAWKRARELLDAGALAEAASFLGTVRPDGRPHSARIGAAWHDGNTYFQTGQQTRKARNLETNPACTLSTSLTGIDLVFEGSAERITDGPTLEAVTAVWREGGWAAEVSRDGIVAPYNAPGTGPPPWQVYRVAAHTVFGVATAEPYGATAGSSEPQTVPPQPTITGDNRDERSNPVPRDPRQGGGAAGGSIHGALERARRRPAPADDRRALDGGRITDPPAARGDAPDRREPRHRAGGHTRGAGTQRAPGAGDDVLRALGRFRRAQLPGARRRPQARRRRQVPLGGNRRRRLDGRSRAQRARPRRGRPGPAQLHVRGRCVMATVEANGVTLGVEHFGAAAAPLVLLAGGTTMLSWRDALCEALASGGRHVVRYDLRDSGASTTVSSKAPAYTLRDLAADAAALARELDDRPAHLAGIGVSGMVAQVAALNHPAAFSRLTLVGTRSV